MIRTARWLSNPTFLTVAHLLWEIGVTAWIASVSVRWWRRDRRKKVVRGRLAEDHLPE